MMQIAKETDGHTVYGMYLLGGYIDQIIPFDEWGNGYVHTPVRTDDQVIETVMFHLNHGPARSFRIDLTPVPKWARTGFEGARNIARLFETIGTAEASVRVYDASIGRGTWMTFSEEMIGRLTPDLVNQLVDFTKKVADALQVDIATLSTGTDYTLLFENPEDMTHSLHPTQCVYVTETDGDNEAYVSTSGLDAHIKHNSYVLEAAIQRIGRAFG